MSANPLSIEYESSKVDEQGNDAAILPWPLILCDGIRFRLVPTILVNYTEKSSRIGPGDLYFQDSERYKGALLLRTELRENSRQRTDRMLFVDRVLGENPVSRESRIRIGGSQGRA